MGRRLPGAGERTAIDRLKTTGRALSIAATISGKKRLRISHSTENNATIAMVRLFNGSAHKLEFGRRLRKSSMPSFSAVRKRSPYLSPAQLLQPTVKAYYANQSYPS